MQTNSRLPPVSTMRRAQQCRYFASSLPPRKRHSRLTTVRRGCKTVTTRRDSWRSHVHRTYIAQRVQSFKLQTANVRGRGVRPLAFLWGIQRGYSLRKENTPFGVAARTPLSLPRLRGKRCSPFGLSFPPRGARKAPAPLRAQKKSTLTGALFQIAEN